MSLIKQNFIGFISSIFVLSLFFKEILSLNSGIYKISITEIIFFFLIIFVLIKYYKKLSDLEKIELYYHIIKFFIINFYKFNCNTNKIPTVKKFKKTFIKIIESNDLYEYYITLENYKNKNSKFVPTTNPKLINMFIGKFSKYINLIYKKNNNITFIRHLKTNLNDGSFLGQGRNPEISKNIKLDFTNNQYKFIFSSPYKRALQTANKYKKKSNKIKIDNLLSEINYGKFEALTIFDLKRNYLKFIKKWEKGLDIKFPNGENTQQVYIRVKLFCDKLVRKINKNEINGKVLIVSHNVFLRCLIGNCYNIKKKYWHLLKINHNDDLNFIIYENTLIPDLNRKMQFNILKKVYD